MTSDANPAHNSMPSFQPNPALQQLDVLVGAWEMELSNSSFLPHPSDTMKGQVTFAWAQDGAFLLMRMGGNSGGPPDAVWLIDRDESAPTYTVFYYDARHVSRIYAMIFSEREWKMWREEPGFWQRFEGRISEDGKTITAHWDKSPDNTTWEHDFDVTYMKVEQALCG